ncbi:MAG: hypothetical protein ACOH2F_03735 [Cellulomonas sp.]
MGQTTREPDPLRHTQQAARSPATARIPWATHPPETPIANTSPAIPNTLDLREVARLARDAAAAASAAANDPLDPTGDPDTDEDARVAAAEAHERDWYAAGVEDLANYLAGDTPCAALVALLPPAVAEPRR